MTWPWPEATWARSCCAVSRCPLLRPRAPSCAASVWAMCANWARPWPRCSAELIEAAGVETVTLDFDSTYVFSRSKQPPGRRIAPTRRVTPCTRCCASMPPRARRSTPGCGGARSGHVERVSDTFLAETLRRVPDGVAVRCRLDSGFYSGGARSIRSRRPGSPTCAVCLSTRPDAGDRHRYRRRMLDSLPRQGRRRGGRVRLPAGRGGTVPPLRRQAHRSSTRASKPASTTGGYRYWILVTNDYTTERRRSRIRAPPQGRCRSRHARAQVQLRAARLPQTRLHGQLGLAASGLPRPQPVLLAQRSAGSAAGRDGATCEPSGCATAT